MGWPGCHVIVKLIFVAFNKHAEIPANANQPGSCNQALRLTLWFVSPRSDDDNVFSFYSLGTKAEDDVRFAPGSHGKEHLLW